MGVGLEFESEEILKRLETVFKDRRSGGRRIRQLYTGLLLEYDPKSESLTIGGTTEIEKILRFVAKIPLRY